MVDYFIFIFVCFVFYPYFFLFDDFLKMFTLNEEQRWYIVNEWKKGSKSFSRIARFLNCHISRIYRVINYYRCPHNVNYGHDVGRPPALNSKQIKQLDRAIQKNDQLLLLNYYQSQISTLTNARYHVIDYLLVIVLANLSLKSKTIISMNKNVVNLLYCIIVLASIIIFLKMNVMWV